MDLDLLLVIFAISFVSNATPFFGAPYTLIASSILLKTGITFVNFVEVIIVTALGAATSKSIMYALGVAARRGLKNNKNVKFFSKFINTNSFYVTLFVTSVIPFLPLDDLIYLLGGVEKAKLLKMLEISFIAKIVKSSIQIPLEVFGILQISEVIGVAPLETGIISSIVLTVLAIILFKLDWEDLYRKIEKRINAQSYMRKR